MKEANCFQLNFKRFSSCFWIITVSTHHHASIIQTELLREAAKKVIFLVVEPLRGKGEGGKAGPLLEKRTFFEAEII